MGASRVVEVVRNGVLAVSNFIPTWFSHRNVGPARSEKREITSGSFIGNELTILGQFSRSLAISDTITGSGYQPEFSKKRSSKSSETESMSVILRNASVYRVLPPYSACGARSMTRTLAPDWCAANAADNPATPVPTTKTSCRSNMYVNPIKFHY